MFAGTDVDYRPDGTARAAAVLFRHWTDETPLYELIARLDDVEPYQPGEFYRRELPCLNAVLELATLLTGPLDAVIIDGYVTLDAAGQAGLGLHLYEALSKTVPVIGVAKTAFRGSEHAVALRRGGSLSPLYVTAAGIDMAEAAQHVAAMAGPHRLPTLLKRADQACRRAP
jgi:deoxyribonuclease V